MADKFIMLTHCQFRKNYFQNRFNIGDEWYTMSVKKGLEPIKDKIYVNPKNDWDGIKSKLPKYKTILDDFDDCILESLEATNCLIIKKICKMLDIKTEIVSDYPSRYSSTDRLVDLCMTYGADEYIAGSGGMNYMELDKFKEDNIKVNFQKEEDKIKKPILEILNERL